MLSFTRQGERGRATGGAGAGGGAGAAARTRPIREWQTTAKNLRAYLERVGGRERVRRGATSVFELRSGNALRADALGAGRVRARLYGSLEACGCSGA